MRAMTVVTCSAPVAGGRAQPYARQQLRPTPFARLVRTSCVEALSKLGACACAPRGPSIRPARHHGAPRHEHLARQQEPPQRPGERAHVRRRAGRSAHPCVVPAASTCAGGKGLFAGTTVLVGCQQGGGRGRRRRRHTWKEALAVSGSPPPNDACNPLRCQHLLHMGPCGGPARAACVDGRLGDRRRRRSAPSSLSSSSSSLWSSSSSPSSSSSELLEGSGLPKSKESLSTRRPSRFRACRRCRCTRYGRSRRSR